MASAAVSTMADASASLSLSRAVTEVSRSIELRSAAASHGWSLDGVDLFELAPPESLLDESQQQSLLYSSDLELGETTKHIFDAVERTKAQRVVVDSRWLLPLPATASFAEGAAFPTAFLTAWIPLTELVLMSDPPPPRSMCGIA